MNSKMLAVSFVFLSAFASNRATAEDSMNPIQTALSATTISGYVDTSAEWTLHRLDPTGLGWDSWPDMPFRGESKANGFNLNVVKLSLAKPLDESEWASGYKVDLLFGPDAVGYNPSVNGDSDQSLAVKQAYVALRTPLGNGIDWKLGTFDTVIGYETFEAGNNPNFTRSWGYAIEPTQHTGILGTYRVNEHLAFAAGVANTLTAGINNRNTNPGETWHKTYLASIAVTAPEDGCIFGGSTFYVGAVGGFADGPDDQNNFYVGATFNTPVAGLKTGIAFDYVENLGGTDGVNDYQDDAWVMGFYFSYQATERLSLHARGEYGDLKYKFTIPGFTDRGHEYMTGLTGTVQYDLWKNVLSRIEVRWDQMHTKGNAVDIGVTEYDYVNATQMGIYANFIYKF